MISLEPSILEMVALHFHKCPDLMQTPMYDLKHKKLFQLVIQAFTYSQFDLKGPVYRFLYFFFLTAYHSGIKQHTCEQCGISFSIVNKLNIHIRLVHEGKKYTCDFCEREYTCPKSLKDHKVKNHGIDKTRKYKYDDV